MAKKRSIAEYGWNGNIAESGIGAQKKSILLKRQMSETRFQEYKRQQMHQMTEELQNENIDTFLSTQKGKEKLSKLLIIIKCVGK